MNTRNFRFWRDSNAKSYKKLQHNFLRKIISNLLLEIKANFRGKKLKHFRMSLSRFFKFETRFRSTFERTFCHNIHNSFTWLAYVFLFKGERFNCKTKNTSIAIKISRCEQEKKGISLKGERISCLQKKYFGAYPCLKYIFTKTRHIQSFSLR